MATLLKLPSTLQSYRSFLHGLFDAITSKKAAVNYPRGTEVAQLDIDLVGMAEQLLSNRGEASGVARAAQLLAAYEGSVESDKLAFLLTLARRFGPDMDQIQCAVSALLNGASAADMADILVTLEPRRQELIRRLNLAPGGTAALLRMRTDLVGFLKTHPELKPVDRDFLHLLSSWFNRGFLVLRRIDWRTPANILEKIIQYEAVHAIKGWNDLRGRIESADRRCFAFFHPALLDDPLIFVEVALTCELPDAIEPLIKLDRTPINPTKATTAAFYSISNCNKGLIGISFGNFLIKQVVEELRSEFPLLRDFVTLSPMPGFATWLAGDDGRRAMHQAGIESDDLKSMVARPNWHLDIGSNRSGLPENLKLAGAMYLARGKTREGRPLDPVARFHLGNGASIERVSVAADLSENGLRQSHGLMVNYRYSLNRIEENHEAFAGRGEVILSDSMKDLLAHTPAALSAMAILVGGQR